MSFNFRCRITHIESFVLLWRISWQPQTSTTGSNFSISFFVWSNPEKSSHRSPNICMYVWGRSLVFLQIYCNEKISLGSLCTVSLLTNRTTLSPITPHTTLAVIACCSFLLLQAVLGADPLFHLCSSTSGNFTGSSPYEVNLNKLTSFLYLPQDPFDGLRCRLNRPFTRTRPMALPSVGATSQLPAAGRAWPLQETRSANAAPSTKALSYGNVY